jgi:uncharacterized protein
MKAVFVVVYGLFIALGAVFAHVSPGEPDLSLGGRTYDTIIASDNASRVKGLSGRENLRENQAMLFVFDAEDQLCFWMKDMRFSIDMVWLDANKRVIHIEQDVSPKTYPTSFCGSQPAQYVVETKANATRGLRVGDRADF